MKYITLILIPCSFGSGFFWSRIQSTMDFIPLYKQFEDVLGLLVFLGVITMTIRKMVMIEINIRRQDRLDRSVLS